MSEYASPRLEKTDPAPWDYRKFTWPMFVRLLAWAQEAAPREHVTIYLVGSALTKGRPRDIDIGVTIPVSEFEQRFGIKVRHDEEWATGTLATFGNKNIDWISLRGRLHSGAWRAVGTSRRVDLKVVPDVWWADKPRLLLAKP